jgi:hypothetical protein
MTAATTIATHEAAHTVGCIVACGMVPSRVRVDHPDVGIGGITTANWEEHSPDFNYLVATLMGPLSEGHRIEWKPSKDGRIREDDERIAARLVEHLGLERHHFFDALATADYLLARDDVRAMVRLIAVALDRVPVLNERQLRELLGPELLDPYLESNYAIGATP